MDTFITICTVKVNDMEEMKGTKRKHMRKTTRNAHAVSVQLSIYNYSRREANRISFLFFFIFFRVCSCTYDSILYALEKKENVLLVPLVKRVTSLFTLPFFPFMNLLIYYLRSRREKKKMKTSTRNK